MSHLSQRKTVLCRSLDLLKQVTEGERLREPASSLEAQRQLQFLRDELDASEQPALALLASIANRIAARLNADQGLDDAALQAMVTEIAAHVVQDVQCRLGQAPGTRRRTELKLNAPEVTLALRDGQRLGELLVKMNLLTQAQVDEAVKLQRVTGQRLGELLVQRRALTPEMLQHALALQTQRRNARKPIDPWSHNVPG